jgi:hypothetical protein
MEPPYTGSGTRRRRHGLLDDCGEWTFSRRYQQNALNKTSQLNTVIGEHRRDRPTVRIYIVKDTIAEMPWWNIEHGGRHRRSPIRMMSYPPSFTPTTTPYHLCTYKPCSCAIIYVITTYRPRHQQPTICALRLCPVNPRQHK